MCVALRGSKRFPPPRSANATLLSLGYSTLPHGNLPSLRVRLTVGWTPLAMLHLSMHLLRAQFVLTCAGSAWRSAWRRQADARSATLWRARMSSGEVTASGSCNTTTCLL